MGTDQRDLQRKEREEAARELAAAKTGQQSSHLKLSEHIERLKAEVAQLKHSASDDAAQRIQEYEAVGRELAGATSKNEELEQMLVSKTKQLAQERTEWEQERTKLMQATAEWEQELTRSKSAKEHELCEREKTIR